MAERKRRTDKPPSIMLPSSIPPARPPAHGQQIISAPQRTHERHGHPAAAEPAAPTSVCELQHESLSCRRTRHLRGVVHRLGVHAAGRIAGLLLLLHHLLALRQPLFLALPLLLVGLAPQLLLPALGLLALLLGRAVESACSLIEHVKRTRSPCL